MKYTYEVVTSPTNGEVNIYRTDADGLVTWIPSNPANRDYQRYLNPEADQPIGGNI